MVHVHYKQIEVCTWSVADFFNDFLCDEDIIADVLRKDIFDQALVRLGPPDASELYGFVPALALGGGRNSHSLEKMRMNEHLSFLFQL